ncbi:phospholipid carrier-dependent glycosyltransferase [Acrocarpospora phusangensis]|uniref:Polyprenol-phosphate-mannose--protein mannosyltransferase n=1 Tax=Acrocarpospora phusangensis TaxID=1070424 RepID=A0A919UQ33_9ACTN|nr:phospholipid carrier-dependent glycosyltransferase [Acrocarpospora phusangensis]GIH26402.1 phospholipid carrier-dependent glycosyltransferase [Acrocarpospora phusangensis]
MADSPSARDRLLPPFQDSVLWGWAGPLLVTAFGAYLRLRDLGKPHAVMFDETYYAKEAYSLIKFGVERTSVEEPNIPLLNGGEVFKSCDVVQECASYVVHPPLGKWAIGLGELLSGVNPFGWRIMAALLGTLSILILARTARRMTRSTLLGSLAGFLLAIDGLHLVLSRAALLDIFVTFWVIAAFACLIVDRDRTRERLVAWYESSRLEELGPRLGWRPWRLAGGLCLGAALATKWSGIFYVLAFTVMVFVWDMGARRAIGLRRPLAGAYRLDLPLTAAWTFVLPGVLYVVSFAGWFATAGGYGRNWDRATAHGPAFFVIDSFRSWFDYQTAALSFHTGLNSGHDYQSWPWSWPLLQRPVLFFSEQAPGCGASSCNQAVLGVGTPVIWYGGLLALITMIAWYTATRDWRGGAVLLAYGVGWLPWFYFAISDSRTMYLFYALPMLPFLILAIVLAAGLLIGPSDAPPNRRAVGAAIVGVFTLFALANFWWLQPILTAENITHDDWWRRLLFRSWV